MPNRSTFFFLTTLWSLGFLFCLFSFVQMQRYYPNVCDAEGAPKFKYVRFVNWSSQEAQVYCAVNYVYVGKRPAATCEDRRWRIHGSCQRYLWMSPDKGTVFSFPTPLKAGGKFSFCATVTPYKETEFMVTLSDAANKTSIVVRVAFSAMVNGVRRTRQVHIYTEQTGQAVDAAQVSSSFPFVVGRKTELKLLAESYTTLGIFVDLKKLLSYSSAAQLGKMTFVRISGEVDVHLVNALCRTCSVEDAPLFENAHITWLEGSWPLEGIVNCNEGDVSWKGGTPPTVKCVSDTWSLNGECLPRYLHNVILGRVYGLPREARVGDEIAVRGVPTYDTSFSLTLTRHDDEPVIYTFRFQSEDRGVVTGTSRIKQSVNKKTDYQTFPLRVDRSFVIVLAITNRNQVAIKVDNKGTPLVFVSPSRLTGPNGLTGFVVKGDVRVTYVDLQYDLEDKDDIGTPVVDTYTCDTNNIPTIANGVATVRREGEKLIADVTCNRNFVWSSEESSFGVCSTKTGWVFNGTCRPDEAKPDSEGRYRLPKAISPGYEICFTAKAGENKRPILSFINGQDVLFSFEIRSDEKKVVANSFVGNTWRSPREFPLTLELQENMVVFVKVKAINETQLRVVINGIHTYEYSSGYPVRDIKYFRTTLIVLVIDLSCKDHKVNFCKEDLAPSLPNGDMRWRKTSNGFSGSATCNEGFDVGNKDNTESRCDVTSGWVVSKTCTPEQKLDGYLLPRGVTAGYAICFSAKQGEEKWPTLSFSDRKEVIINFEIRPDEKKLVASSLVQNRWGSHKEFPLTFEIKKNSVVFVKVKVLMNKDLEVTFNGIHTYTYTSARRVEDIKYFKTSLTVMEIDLVCNQQQINFCRKELAPSLNNGSYKWFEKNNMLVGSGTCIQNFELTKIRNISSHCSVEGWTISEACIPTREKKPTYNYLLPRIFDPKKKMCFSAKLGREYWPTLSFSNGKNIIIHFEIRFGKKIIAKSLANDTWSEPTGIFLPFVLEDDIVAIVKVTVVNYKTLEVAFNGIYSYRFSFEHRLHEFRYFNTSLVILENKFDCIQYRENTCRTWQPPALVIGDVTWWRTEDNTEGSTVCDMGFVFTYLTCTRNLCDLRQGWEMTEECRVVRL